MTVDKRLLTSFLMPPEWEVMGFNLKPFCLLHQLTLQAIESPFMVEGKPLDIDDIVIAYRVCSGYDGIMSMKKPPTWKEKWFNARLTVSPAYCNKAVEDFQAYIECYCTSPKIWEKEKDSNEKEKKDGIPASLLMATLMLRRTNISELEVWRMPIGKMSWYCTALGYIEGADITVISTDEEEKMDSELEALAKFQQQELAKYKR